MKETVFVPAERHEERKLVSEKAELRAKFSKEWKVHRVGVGVGVGEGEGEFHKIIPSYLRRSFRTLLKGSSSGKFGIYTASNGFSNQNIRETV